MTTIHEVAKNSQLRGKLKTQLLETFNNKLDEIIDRIASLEDIFFIRKEYDTYLDEARWNYFYGYFIASINMSCVTAERLLIDLIMEANIQVNKHSLTIEDKESAFSGQLQSKRIQFAKSFKLISEDTFKHLKKLDSYRHKYIHPNKPIDKNIVDRDAKDAILKLHKIIESSFPYMINSDEKKSLKQEVINTFTMDEL